MYQVDLINDESLIGDLYEQSRQMTPNMFREFALNRLIKTLSVDGAVWASGPIMSRQLETVSCVGLPNEFIQKLEDTTDLNPIMSLLLKAQGEPVDMREAMEDDRFFDSRFFHECFEPYDVHRVLSSLKLESQTQVFTLLSVYRKDQNRVFTESEKKRQQRMLYHLHRAEHVCYQTYVQQQQVLPQLACLSHREKQVVAELQKNQTMKQIARQLSLSPSTVANHLYRIYQKLDVNGKAELMAVLS